MRFVAAFLVVITLLVGAFFGYCYYGAQMQIVGVSVSVTPATDALGTYNEILSQLAEETFLGKQYRQSEFIMPDSYAFLTLTVHMKNNGLLPQDWIRVDVTPGASDVLQLYENRTPTLKGRGSGDFATTILTRTGVETQRKITVTYYVLGRPFSAEFQM